MRQAALAPVDVIGCHRLADPNEDPEVNRFQTLVALMLSAQTRDVCTAEAVHNLKRVGCTVKTVAALSESAINECIRMVGMHNNKARYLKAAAQKLLAEHKGVVPSDVEAIMQLPGVGPKMAHLFMQCADGVNSGIGVDVHVHRIAQRFRWVPRTVKTPEDTRKALEEWLPKEHWAEINEILVGFGQTVCTPRNPRCAICSANKLCPNAFKESASRVDASGCRGSKEALARCGSSQELVRSGSLQDVLPQMQLPSYLDDASLAKDPAAAGRNWRLADIEDAGGSPAAATKPKASRATRTTSKHFDAPPKLAGTKRSRSVR